MSSINSSTILRIMIDAARKVGRVLIRDFGEVENLQVSQKGPGDFVTASDLRAEKILIEELSKARPDYAFLTEESGDLSKGKSWEYRWVIDPIDGTNNFMHGIPYFCTSIGLEKKTGDDKSEIVAGVIFAPVHDEMYYTEKGLGACLNGRRLIVSSRSKLKDALLSTGYFWNDSKQTYNTIELMKELSTQTTGVRSAGAAALDLAYVAAGRYDGFWHCGLKSWDLAAGSLMVQEAKGMVSEISTKQGILKSGNILATNSNIHEHLIKAISKHPAN